MSRTTVKPNSYSDLRAIENRVSALERVVNNPGGGFFRPGDLKLTAAVATPSGWLVADGSTFLAATYPALAAAIGSTTLPHPTPPSGLTWLVKT